MGTDAAISAGQLVNEDGSRLVSPYVTLPPGFGDQWYKARHEAGTRQVKVVMWGDSNGAGSGSTDSFNLAWFARVGNTLKSLYGDGGTGYLNWAVNNSFTGVWTAGIGFGSGKGRASAAASLSWTGLVGTQIQIFHENTATPTGVYRYRVDGGGFTTVTPPTDVSIEPGVITIAVADGTHTLDIEWVSGQIGIYGVYATRSTGIVMQRCAQSGRAASEYARGFLGNLIVGTTNTSATITSAAPGAFNSSMIGRNIAGTGIPADATITATASATSATMSLAATATGTITARLTVNSESRVTISTFTVEPAFALAPGLGRADLVIVALGPNDSAHINDSSWDATMFVEGISSIIRPHTGGATLTTTPDVIIMIEHIGNYFDTATYYPVLTAAAASAAQGHGAALVDIWGMGRRSWKFWDNQGHFFDTIHPSNSGHAQYAAPITELLTRT